MSKKEQLLTETQVRQFMKLANLQPLTPGFVGGLSEATPDWGMGKDEKSRTDPGEEDYTWRKGRKSKTRPGADMEEALGTIGPGGGGVPRKEDDEDEVKESHGRGRGESDAGHGTNDPREARPGARLREEDEYDEYEEENADDDLEHAEDLEMDAEEDLGDIGMDPAIDAPGREVSVDDFLAALEVALEDVLGDEVEVDQEEDVEEEEIVDLENGDEMEMEMGAVEEDPALQEMISTITKRVAKRIVKEALQKKK